ncbi:ATP-dependent DNA ligase [Alicyclobacillus shizuokensis]|uniref:ATP-dependent DNA ligase n=1 Tax=Alicyclobacillus shizuokensis TaxID=392014 RepID=UPI00082CEC3D|nr:hypothetical protein [Alicyclobacillus shizuokensis]MCL6625426.1 hypothetical protein [Alicyclobacillus shizuokensis]
MTDDWSGLMPMEPVLVSAPSTDKGVFFQVKWDGVRMLMQRRGNEVRLWNRKGRVRTHLYPELVAWAKEQAQDAFVIDGEVVSLGTDGRPDFRRVLRRDLARRPRREIPVVYMAFDCLQLSGQSLLESPFERRQEALREAVSQSGVIQVCDNYSDGRDLYERMQALGMEGVVGKRAGSRYYPGEKRTDWQKVKCWRHITLDALFLTVRDGRPASVLVGERADLEHPAGAVATGIRQEDWAALWASASPAPTTSRPRELWSLPPGIRLHIRYLDWTDSGALRHPVVEAIHWPASAAP